MCDTIKLIHIVKPIYDFYQIFPQNLCRRVILDSYILEYVFNICKYIHTYMSYICIHVRVTLPFMNKLADI